MICTYILRDATVLQFDPSDAVAAQAAAAAAERAGRNDGMTRVYREDNTSPDPGPRATLANELRDWWRGPKARADRRTDAAQLLAETSGDPRARLAAWSATAWRRGTR
jgi:hypothetical protein